VNNAQAKFADNMDIPAKEQIEMLGDRSSQRVFNRDHRRPNRSLFHTVEDLEGSSARNDFRAWNHRFGRLMAKRAEFTLNRNFHE